MLKYISTLFAAALIVLCFSCSSRTIDSFEVPQLQDSQEMNQNSNLDQFVDEVKRFPEENSTEEQVNNFYNDNNSSN